MFKKLAALVESKEVTQEIAEALDSEISVALKTLRDENKAIRTEKEDLSKNYDEILKSKNGLDEQVKGLDEKIAKAKKEGHDEVVAQLEDERASKAELQENLANLQKANTNLKLDGAVANTLKEFDVMDSHRDTTEFMLRSRVSVNDKGDMVYTDNGTESSIEDGFKVYFANNESKLNPQGNAGSGAGGAGGSGGATKSDFSGDTKSRIASVEAMIAAG